MPKIERTPRRRVESTILAEIRAWAGTQPDLVLWRNNTGSLQDATGRWVQFGLCEGSADLVGCLTIAAGPSYAAVQAAIDEDRRLVTERVVARFLAVEVKRPGEKPSAAQAAWLDVVRRAGGIAGVVTGVEEAEMLVMKARAWEI